MDKQAVKDLIYGGLIELINNRTFYYSSSVSWEYNKFTEEGQKALSEFMGFMAIKMKEAENQDLDKRAKNMVMKTLKGEET